MTARSALGVCLVLASLASAEEASAFCRTTTVPVVSDFQPRVDKCWEEGVPLYWKSACVSYSVQKDASRSVPLAVARDVVTQAFAKWAGASCPGDEEGRSRPSIDARDLGPVACGEVGYDRNGGPNRNVIVFRDDGWARGDPGTLALTTVSYSPKTGEIFDADMEINTFANRVTFDDEVALDGYDFASIVTHEAGHFLGLAHSGDSRATMFANYIPGATAMRLLALDDVLGICAAYRPDGTRAVMKDASEPQTTCDPNPRGGLSSACQAEDDGVCAVATPGRARGASASNDAFASAGAAVLAAAFSAYRRRVRRRRG